jgi:hypothetical protein
MAHLSTQAPQQAALPLSGGANGNPLFFCTAPSRRHFVAVRGGLIYEVIPVYRQPLWRARIRAAQGGAVVDDRIFAFEDIAKAKDWLQGRAALYTAGGGQ